MYTNAQFSATCRRHVISERPAKCNDVYVLYVLYVLYALYVLYVLYALYVLCVLYVLYVPCKTLVKWAAEERQQLE
jgi:hypothetical protein